ncbi:amidase signature domain-containing protein [Xylariales sp. PMI_506]|nr:amidase signature domain-containing protein [Xylariales sp. PMI_506]
MPPKRSKAKRPWQEVAKEAQDIRDKSLSDVDGVPSIPDSRDKNVMNLPVQFLDGITAKIISSSVQDLASSIKSGELSARQVVQAFLRSATVAQKLTNCVTELLPLRALGKANQLDALFATADHTALLGPLHGIPISIKSHIGIKDCHMPSGYISLWEKVARRDALVVQILEGAGAVVHARTTEPQTMMHLECASNLFGTTTNPHNTDLSSGGSSGGEGALIALGGSPLGIGSDVGGSIRMPAAACGIYGLKPTAFRVPTTGWSSTPPGADPIPTVLGPMSRSLEGIELLMRTILAAEPWKLEPALVPLPWRVPELAIAPTADSPLRIGVMWNDRVVLPHPPVTSVLEDFVNKIKALEHVEVIEFPAYKHDEAWAIVSSLYAPDGGKADVDLMKKSGEPMLTLSKWMIEENVCVKDLSREELEYWLEEREEFRLEYAEEWNKTGTWHETTKTWKGTMDALICPVAPWVASKPGTARYWTYTAIWNLLDYPALAFPAGRVSKGQAIANMRRTKFMNQTDREIWGLYDSETFLQMPVGLQLVGRRFDDEKIVQVLRFLQERI